MRSRNRLVILTVLAALAFGLRVSSAVSRHGTWNADGFCGGFPEEPCSSGIIYLAESWGDADLASCTAAIEEARKVPFPSQIALAGMRHQVGPVGSESDFLRVPLKLPTAWINSGVWTEDGSLLLVDSSQGKLLRLSGSRLETVDLGRHALQASDLRATEKGFILKLRDGRFVALDHQGRLTMTLGPLTSEAGEAGVQSVVNWVPVGDSVLAFGDILKPDSTWTSGWLRLSLHKPASFNLLRSMPVTTPERRLYHLGYPYAASIRSTGYFLAMDGTRSQLLSVSPAKGGIEQRELSLPSDLSPASAFGPSLPTGGAPADIVARYQIVEKSVLPVGLYSQGRNLYLLVRRPVGTSETEWELVRLDPESGDVLGRVSLPTRAKHLLVIPGRELWAVIEKGSVQSPGAQDVDGLLLIPDPWIDKNSESDRRSRTSNPSSTQVEQPGRREMAR